MDTIKPDILLIRKNASVHISSACSTIISGKKKTILCFTDFETVPYSSPGGQVVKTLPSAAGVLVLMPPLGVKIPHASRPKNPKNVKQKQYCNKFNEDF